MRKRKIIIDSAGIKHLELAPNYHYRIELVSSGAEVNIQALWYTKSSQETNLIIEVYHCASHTKANTVIKTVVSELATANIVGRVMIAPHCQAVQSFLTERFLLLANTAKVFAVPDLEISSNDVRCSHALSISHFDYTQLFYLMSRGISQRQAEKMLIDGFLYGGKNGS